MANFIVVSLIILLITPFLTRFFLYIITIEGSSMLPTLSEMDRIFVLRFWHKRQLKRGQIVLIRFQGTFPLNNIGESCFYVKRIIGLPGDTISVDLSKIHDLPFSSSQFSHDTNDGKRVWNIPRGYCFLQGDNFPHSTDSYFWGPIKIDAIVGVMLIKLPRKNDTTK